MKQAVFYFGGYQASEHDIAVWLRSARAQQPRVEFIGFPWTGGASARADSAVKTFSKHGKYDSVIDDIQGNGADTIFIVGHSSGCAIANAVDAGLEWTENIVLVALDGFTPNKYQLDRDTTQVWGARCDGVNSRNFPGFASGKGRVFHATDCKSEWALHFSLVNANANDSLVDSVGNGYANCRANLLFLPNGPAFPAPFVPGLLMGGRRCAASTLLIEPAYDPCRSDEAAPKYPSREATSRPVRLGYLRTSLQTFMRCGSPDSSH